MLYFYPKDDTPGCTTQACSFRDEYKTLQLHKSQVLGISVDSSNAHAKFAEKYNLPFPLLVDIDGNIARQYQSLLNLGLVKIAKRHTFIIDPQGLVQKIYLDVNVKNHSRQILSDLSELQA